MRAAIDRSVAAIAIAILAIAVSGCGGPKVTYAEVDGTVTLGGKPLPGVEVLFYPVTEENKGLPYAMARTDAAGKYRLATVEGQPGAVVGKNRVVINWPARDRSDEEQPKEKAATVKKASIPVRYTVAGMTPLVYEVAAGGPQTIDVRLDN